MRYYLSDNENLPAVLFLPGNLMSGREYDEILKEIGTDYSAIAIGYDGFDDETEDPFPGYIEEGRRLEAIIEEQCEGFVPVIFADGLGLGPAVAMLKRRPELTGRLVICGAEWMDYGAMNMIVRRRLPMDQYRMLRQMQSASSAPVYLKVAVARDEEGGLARSLNRLYRKASLDSLKASCSWAFRLFRSMPEWPEQTAYRLTIWYGGKERGAEKVLARWKNVFPQLETKCFPDLEHGELLLDTGRFCEALHGVLEEEIPE